MRRAEIRDHLLDTAQRLFNRLGWHATGVDLIQAESGVAKTTLYRHFPTKDDLMVAVLERQSERARAAMQDFAAAAGADPLAQTLASFDWLARWFVQPDFSGCLFVSAASEYADPANPMFQAAVRHKEAVRQWLTGNLVEAGRPDADELGADLALLHEGAITLAQLGGGAAPAHRARALAERLLATPAPSTPA